MSDVNWLGLAGSAVVVAGAGGIGAASAVAFARHGAKVLIVDRDERQLAAAVAEVNRAVPGAQAEGLEADLTRAGSGRAVVAAARQRLGGIDVLLHAIGVNDRRPILDFETEEWQRIIQVNLGTVFELAQAVGRHMVDQGHGRIVIVSSVSGQLAHANHAPYAASKGGVNQLMRAMAREWANYGVTVNAVAPGYIETELTAEHLAKPGVRDNLVSLVPSGRLGTPEEVAGPILFLSSAQARFVTGHVLYVDGGRTLV